MGVDAKVYLPGNVRHENVAEVMGILMGLEKVKRSFGSGEDSYSWAVPGAIVRTTQSPAMLSFEFYGDQKLVDGEMRHTCYYHFESSKGSYRQLSFRSNAFWIAVGRGLVDFFGGWMDYADCDAEYEDYCKPDRPDHENNPEFSLNIDGCFEEIGWHNMLTRTAEIVPLTVEDLENARQYAAYKEV